METPGLFNEHRLTGMLLIVAEPYSSSGRPSRFLARKATGK